MTISPETLVQIQSNFKEMFLMMPSTKNWSECLAQLNNLATSAKNRNIFINDISLATGQYIILCARTQVSDQGP